MKEKNGINGYAMKAMMMSGLSLVFFGTWHVGQLTDELQQIISKHLAVLNGLAANPEDVKTKPESGEDLR